MHTLAVKAVLPFGAVVIGTILAVSPLWIPLPATAAGPNLVQNGAFETAGGGGNPANWARGRWGTNTATFAYPVAGTSGSGAEVRITQYTSGDAKWYFNDVAVTPGKVYTYSNNYKSNVGSHITARYQLSNGTFQYIDLAHPNSSSNVWVGASVEFIPPTNAQSVTIFHLIKAVGTLTLDNVAVSENDTTPPPPPPPPTAGNLIANPSLEIQSGTTPQDWFTGRWGTNAAAFTYPTTGQSGARAARIQITSYTSGDAKWYFKEVAVQPNTTYTFSDFYKSNVTTHITAQYRLTNGSLQYVDLAHPGSSGGAWQKIEMQFTTPPNIQSLTIFHLIKSVGTLETDTYALVREGTDGGGGTLAEGFVSIGFDDNWKSSFDTALPILNARGFKSTHYVVTNRLDTSDTRFYGRDEMLQIQAQGHEVGAHTRTHAHLTTLNSTQLQSEVQGSVQDLVQAGIQSVKTFAYPFGEYNSTVINAVKNAGLISARGTDSGFNEKGDNLYTLKGSSMHSDTSIANVRAMIDRAQNEKLWLILFFHRVDTSGNFYSVTPTTFTQIVDYIDQKNIPVLTMEQGAARVAQ